MPRVNLLIADDVGLGKTIESGMVVLELMLRHRAKRVLVVCPSSLQIKWRDEMLEKFGLDFGIVDSALMKGLRRKRGIHANPWITFPAPHHLHGLPEARVPSADVPRDIAAPTASRLPPRVRHPHRRRGPQLCPVGTGKFALDSQRTQALREIGKHFEHKLFLTATPHNGYKESFSALLELLDNQRFARGTDARPQAAWPSWSAASRAGVAKNGTGSDKFPQRTLEHIPVDYTAEERTHPRPADPVRRTAAEGYRDNPERFATEFVLKLLKKRLFSSPAAFLTTLNRTRHLCAMPKRRRAEATRSALCRAIRTDRRGVRRRRRDTKPTEALETASRLSASRRRRRPSSSGCRLGRSAPPLNSTAKVEQASELAERDLRPNGQWNQERVIIFTEYRDTQKWLQDILATRGFKEGDRLLTSTARRTPKSAKRSKRLSSSTPTSPVRILLATDAASEGIGPPAPLPPPHPLRNPLEPQPPGAAQRPHRPPRPEANEGARLPLRRQGISRNVEKRTLAEDLVELEEDLEFLMRVARKIETIREDLGKVGTVIAEQVEEAMLGRRKTLDTGKAEKEAEPMRKMLKFERDLQKQVQALMDQYRETRRELRLSPDNIQQVVSVGLALAGQPTLTACQDQRWQAMFPVAAAEGKLVGVQRRSETSTYSRDSPDHVR